MEMNDTHQVVWTLKVEKQLDKVPRQIAEKFYAWVTAVKLAGLRTVRQRSGFHDEPLKGPRRGQRSVRLNVSYRAIYVEKKDGSIEFIEVVEVTKHEY